MRIGVLSDTHLPSVIRRLDDLGPQAAAVFEGVDLILHAGDVTAPSVLGWCEQFAPTLVARGNNDVFEHPAMDDRHVVDAHGWRIGLVHQVRPESRPMAELLADGMNGEAVDVLIAGDTHVERLEFRDEVLFMNPGSPTLPHHKDYRLGTVALIEVCDAWLRATIEVLGETPGRPNPCVAASLVICRDDAGRTVAQAPA